MVTTKLGAAALITAASITLASGANAACWYNETAETWTCAGQTVTRADVNGEVRTTPTVGVPGRYIREDGQVSVTVYLGHNGTGKQKFHWQE